MICDTPVAQCANWADHWCADPSDNEVKRQRALVLKKGALPAARCSLAELKQIYATEVNVPLAQITLKNYQRQVVSWMLDNERNGFAVSSLVRFADNLYKDDGPAPIQKIYGGVVALEMGMELAAALLAQQSHGWRGGGSAQRSRWPIPRTNGACSGLVRRVVARDVCP